MKRFKKKHSRFWALVLAIVMIFTMMPANVFADSEVAAEQPQYLASLQYRTHTSGKFAVEAAQRNILFPAGQAARIYRSCLHWHRIHRRAVL